MRDAIERVLAEHQPATHRFGRCACGFLLDYGAAASIAEQLSAHQAEMIAAHFEQVGDIRMMLGDPLGKPVPVWRLRPEGE